MTDLKAHAADTPDAPRPAKADFAPVIRSKVQPPALRADTLTRERLARRLDEALASRVVLVVADAGYGKTTLLADYAARSGYRTLWYRLSPSDADSVTWANYLVAACREVDPSFGATTTSLLASSSAGRLPQDAYIQSFLGELGRWHDAPTLLVLDDYHEIDNNLEVNEIVGRLTEDAPSWLHIVISARRRPHLSFGKLAATAELSELRTDELRFTPAETQRLFAEGYSQPLADDVVKQLDRRTRGWAASLQLFHSSIRGRQPADVARLADSLSGASGPLYDYLAEEVLANVPDDLADFLIRASALEPILPGDVPTLFHDENQSSPDSASSWISEATNLGLMVQSAGGSESFDLHPLLRDFLSRQLLLRLKASGVRALHERLAYAMRSSDPLRACHHFIEAALPDAAMDVLSASVLGTLGLGQWGLASSLIDQLSNVPGGPAVAAIRARHLTSDGNPAAAAHLLKDIDVDACSPDVRAVLRQTWMSIGWRTGDRELIRRTVSALLSDAETPEVLRGFAALYVAAGAIDKDEAIPLPDIARTLLDLAETSRRDGHWFYRAVSLHNAGITLLNAGDYAGALAAGNQALETFHRLGFDASEASSTHSMMATCLFELGEDKGADEHISAAINGLELADAPAELSLLRTSLGDRAKAAEYLAHAESLTRAGRTDIGATHLVDWARAALALPDNPALATQILLSADADWPLDCGQALHRKTELAAAYLLAGRPEDCIEVAVPALARARRRGERRSEVRLAIVVALATGQPDEFERHLADAWSASRLALAELADVISDAGSTVRLEIAPLESAIRAAPKRWLPALRRQLGKGAPDGMQAASLLDRYGELEDVARLRAFAKAYRRRGASTDLGNALARRTSPRITIHDLGRVQVDVGTRTVPLSGMRRKAASLLMFLSAQPLFTANRERVLDELWPDADPSSATNSLNQSLYFLRRELDPWYEDDLSVDYIHFASELVWLDSTLVRTSSGDFVRSAAAIRGKPVDPASAIEVIRSYRGYFAPEFEYEEWAMDWRSRVHSVLLDLAYETIEQLTRRGDIANAREVAMALLDVDPTASEIERRLIWLLWRAGASSAAKSQYGHLARTATRDGLEPEGFDDIVNSRP